MNTDTTNSHHPQHVSFIMPEVNTLNYTMLAYNSVRLYYPTNEIIILDDGSDDGTLDWLDGVLKIDKNLVVYKNTTGHILGHTILYDLGVKMCKNEVFSILHSDMVIGKNYLENMLKHLTPKTVICATRVEPEGIYPPGKEKILKSFGMYHYDFDLNKFDAFVAEEQLKSKDSTNPGFFAPWVMYKKSFLEIGGHDAVSFSPYPIEDDDICYRMRLAGYDLIQSRDSLVFHFISRGHRAWSQNGIKNDHSKFEFYKNRAIRNFIRKWGTFSQFNEYHYPIIPTVYDIGFVVQLNSINFLHAIEPYASKLYVVDNIPLLDEYIKAEQKTTNIDLSSRIMTGIAEDIAYHSIVIYFNEVEFMKNVSENFNILSNLRSIIKESEISIGDTFVLGAFKLVCRNSIVDMSNTLVKVENPTIEEFLKLSASR